MGCTRAQRRRGECPSVDAGCGYRANVSNGKVTIYPTINNSGCYEIKIGLGDATFTFDASNPPATIKRIITADSSGKYTPQITTVPVRSIKRFTSVETVNESFTDASGNTTAVTMPRLNGFMIDGYTNGEYEATGLNNVSSGGGKLLGIQGSSNFTGAIPYNIRINAIQLFTYRYGYAYLDTDGYVNLVKNGSNINTRFNMGNEVSDPYVMEFTIKNDDSTFLCRNIDNKVVEVYAPYSNGNFFIHKGITHDVIRVASGQMLKQAKDGVIEKSVLTDGGYAVAIGENDIVDITPDGNGGIIEIKLSDGSNKIIKRVGPYSINSDNKLIYNGNVIASDIFGLGKFTQPKPTGLMLGKSGIETNIVKQSAYNMFYASGVQESWKNAYDSWYDTQTLPSCGWAGIGETNTTTSTTLLCMKQATTPNNTVGPSIYAIDINGDFYRLSGNTLTKQISVAGDANGFNAINTELHQGKAISITSRLDGIKKFRFSDAETSYDQDSHFFRY